MNENMRDYIMAGLDHAQNDYIKEYWRLKVNWKNDVLMGTYMILLRFQLPCISISKIINHDNSLSGYKSFVHNPVPNATVTLFLFFKIRL